MSVSFGESIAFPGVDEVLSVDRHCVVGLVCRWEVSSLVSLSFEDIYHSVSVLLAS